MNCLCLLWLFILSASQIISDFEQPNSLQPWVLYLGTEFPGAQGNLTLQTLNSNQLTFLRSVGESPKTDLFSFSCVSTCLYVMFRLITIQQNITLQWFRCHFRGKGGPLSLICPITGKIILTSLHQNRMAETNMVLSKI